MTHDHSFGAIHPELSFNSLADITCLPDMIFGSCLTRIIHYICSLCWYYPQLQILIKRYDFRAAYKWLTQNGITSARSSIVWNGFAHVALHLTFGGRANPPLWCTISETVCDVIYDLLKSPWSPSTVSSPHQHKIHPPIHLNEDIPIAPASPMALVTPPNKEGRADVFINDIITVFLNIPEN
jgi:hypothetical protein